MQRLEAIKTLRDFTNPRANVPTPILRDEVEHGGPGLALELQGLKAWEPPAQTTRGGAVAERNGDMLPAQRIDGVPFPARQGDGVPVPGVVDVAHDALQNHIRNAEAHHPIEPLRHVFQDLLLLPKPFKKFPLFHPTNNSDLLRPSNLVQLWARVQLPEFERSASRTITVGGRRWNKRSESRTRIEEILNHHPTDSHSEARLGDSPLHSYATLTTAVAADGEPEVRSDLDHKEASFSRQVSDLRSSNEKTSK